MSILDHPLAWRWTDDAHHILPQNVLARMCLLKPNIVATLDLRSKDWVSRDGLDPGSFTSISRYSADLSAHKTKLWLLEQHPRSDEPVVIVWDAQTALRTDWAVFVDHWSAFCYPSSDDVCIWPPDGDWACCFLHYAEFQFGAGIKPNNKGCIAAERSGASNYTLG